MAGRIQEVTATSKASGIISFPRVIQTSADRSWLARCGRPSDSGPAWTRPAFSFGGGVRFFGGFVEDMGDR